MSTDLCQDDENSQCVNLVGSYECVCAPGYERVNGTCQCELIAVSAHNTTHFVPVYTVTCDMYLEYFHYVPWATWP